MIEVLENKIIYKSNNMEVGYILFSNISDNEISIDKVYVKENKRGEGIASKMLEYAYEYFKNKDIKIIYKCSYSRKWSDKVI